MRRAPPAPPVRALRRAGASPAAPSGGLPWGFLERDAHVTLIGAAQEVELERRAWRDRVERTVERVHAVHVLAAGTHDQVAALDAGIRGRARLGHGTDQ